MKTPRSWTALAVAGCLTLVTAVGLAGCGNMLDSDSTRRVLSERERDSLIARSALPGSAVVGRALEVSDNSAVRATSMDSLTQ